MINRSSYTKPMDGLLPWMAGGEVGKKGESPWQVSGQTEKIRVTRQNVPVGEVNVLV